MEGYGKTMLGDNETSEEERKFDELVEQALADGKIPIECQELVYLTDTMAVRTVVAKEC